MVTPNGAVATGVKRKVVSSPTKKSVVGTKRGVGAIVSKSAPSNHKIVAKSGATVKKTVAKKPTAKIGVSKPATLPSGQKTNLPNGLWVTKNGVARKLHV